MDDAQLEPHSGQVLLAKTALEHFLQVLKSPEMYKPEIKMKHKAVDYTKIVFVGTQIRMLHRFEELQALLVKIPEKQDVPIHLDVCQTLALEALIEHIGS